MEHENRDASIGFDDSRELLMKHRLKKRPIIQLRRMQSDFQSAAARQPGVAISR